ncbi:MAG: hypothetical protein ABFS05_04930 [Bacteroidota bacterium]
MKAIAIVLVSLLFMIPVSYAGNDGGKTIHPKGETEATVVVETFVPATNLIVINLNDENIDKGIPEDILKQFCKVICYPQKVENAATKECVLVGFSYDDDGYIHVESTTSSNEDFNDHVVENIEKIRLRNGSVTIGKQYFAKFSFKKL